MNRETALIVFHFCFLTTRLSRRILVKWPYKNIQWDTNMNFTRVWQMIIVSNLIQLPDIILASYKFNMKEFRETGMVQVNTSFDSSFYHYRQELVHQVQNGNIFMDVNATSVSSIWDALNITFRRKSFASFCLTVCEIFRGKD